MVFDSDDGGTQFDYRLDGCFFNRGRFIAKSLVHQTTVKLLMFADDCTLLTNELQHLTTAFATTSMNTDSI